MEEKLKHLEIIQDTITRMANNSFSLKGWAVTLVSAIFALSSKDTEKAYFLITFIPILVFWGLDAYYLYQERLFRALYDDVRDKNGSDGLNFSMDTSKDKYHLGKNNYCDCLKSKTIFWFYFPLAIISIGIIIVTHI